MSICERWSSATLIGCAEQLSRAACAFGADRTGEVRRSASSVWRWRHASLIPLDSVEDSTDLTLQTGEIPNQYLPHDRRVDMSVSVGEEVPHVHDLTPRNLRILGANDLRHGVGGFADRLYPWMFAVRSTSSSRNFFSVSGRLRSMVSISSMMSRRKSRSRFTA